MRSALIAFLLWPALPMMASVAPVQQPAEYAEKAAKPKPVPNSWWKVARSIPWHMWMGFTLYVAAMIFCIWKRLTTRRAG
ncbi:hypothetical protein [Limnoglobus roseus]|uniref:Uncharacterized protein n=1 Tax=Limnoglobus roseus TaxID=2598579 RepID=A0A5C1AK73_9BACT|nr:hypothetical protein [Limnoglobus roseus]QEL19280.1 hypothetical protein PX52LOC_06343 [Limnoglobus roseus]